MPVERYLVFSALARLGLPARRHPPAPLDGPGARAGGGAEAPGAAAGGGEGQQQLQQRGRGGSTPPWRRAAAGAAAAPDAEAPAAAAAAVAGTRPWWPPSPGWLRCSGGGGSGPGGGAAGAAEVRALPDLGAALRARHPRLRPLRQLGAAGGAAGAEAAAGGSACIVYDVFRPGTPRRAPGPPAFRVAMQRHRADWPDHAAAAAGGGGPPPLRELLALCAASAPAPLRFAVLEGAEPCFFDLRRGALLDLLSQQRPDA